MGSRRKGGNSLSPPLPRECIFRLESRSKEKTISNNSDMAEMKSMFREVLPKQGQLSVEDITTMVLCKPKLLPLKSLTLEKLEKMQQAAQDTVRQQEMEEKEQQQITE
ncbi:BBSome-interacting protein 1 isoform X1 [Pteropus alecto]|uniref:BBSome-interacting protein 1 isoform X1 n=2 Tax=Pteropus TaxID=9401 RepID=A0A6P3QRJ1_PTEVA|nr:BBSome-interacting protein 1 isoform X1 [Pteropus vampyrus]XP_015451825.1 BBSome-interacting protein 1 isoform X1 [Pteropus alecto]XP_039727174.1 BBSome-interacting protein 1 isoform X1 [Pteropus giganteus]